MRTAPYKRVLDRIASYLGEADGLSADDAVLLTPKLNLFVRLAWEFYWWPDLLMIEKRTFRPAWASATTYAAGAEVFNPADGNYYQSVQAANTGHAPTISGVENSAWWAACQIEYSAADWATGTAYTVGQQVRNPADGNYYQCLTAHTAGGTFDASKFGLLTQFVRSLDYAQAGQTEFGEVRFIWDKDPEVNRYAQRQKFRLRPSYIQVLGTVNTVWVEFRPRPNVYVNTVLDAAETYAADTQVYDPATGENWLSNAAISAGESPTTAPTKWDLVPFPYAFVDYVALSAYVALTNREEMAASQGGQPENFSIQQTAGWPLLQLELDKIERQQGQTRQLNVQGSRCSAGGWWYRS